MKGTIYFILIIFFSGILFAQKTFLKWEKIHSPKFSSSEIIYGESPRDFWVMDLTGVLYHYKNDGWKSYPLKNNKSYTRFKYKYLSNSRILVSAVDSMWNSHVFLFEKNSWHKQGVLKNAVLDILSTANHRLFLTGDWGMLVEFINGKLVEIKTPFKNHIIAADVKSSILWLGVRGEGIYSYDGKDFTTYEIEGGKKLEYSEILTHEKDTISFLTGNQNQYYLKNTKFYKSSNRTRVEPHLIHDEALSYYKILASNLPYSSDDVSVSSNYKYKQHLQFSDGRILLLTQTNELYLSTSVSHNFFDDCSSLYGLKGYENRFNYGAGFVYLDKNETPDLFIYSTFPEMFLNKDGSHFVNAYINSSLPKPTVHSKFDFADISKDGLTDFVNTELTIDGPVVNIYNQTDEGNILLTGEVNSVGLLTQRSFENIRSIDFNKDGQIDLDISLYLNKNLQAGNQLIAINDGLDKFSEYDTSFTQITKGWNIQSIFADFNNDGLNDWLIFSRWQPLRVLFQNSEDKLDFKIYNFPGDTLSSCIGGFAFDFNNDGYLDVAVTSEQKLLTIYENERGNNFREVSDKLGLSFVNRNFYSRSVERSMNCGDFNNDGFVDILVSLDAPSNSRNYLFMNEGGKHYSEMALKYNLKDPYVKGACLADIDSDGDLDIFGLRKGNNVLWINNLNDDNYLSVIVEGVKSNTDGIGAKVKVYTAGHIGDEKYLCGFRQIGSEQYGYNQINQRFAHFGLPADQLYDVEINFYGGETKSLTKVKSGQTIVVKEYVGFLAFWNTFPRVALRFVSNHSNQYYFVIILISFIIQFVGAKYGASKFKWKISASLSIVIVNLSLFWLMILLTKSSESFLIKYFLPLLVTVSGVFLPLFIISTIKMVTSPGRTKSELEEDLLRELLQFTHGEWALRNISAILLLFQNYTSEEGRQRKYFELIGERIKTFNDLTRPLLEKIIDLSALLEIASNKSGMLKVELGYVDKFISKNVLVDLDETKVKELASSFLKIKNYIKEIKEIVFSCFSCLPENVIKEISNEYTEVATAIGIEFKKLKNYSDERFALIKTEDLAIVLDNCVQNSIRAIKGSKNPLIEILLEWEAPHIIIKIKDNGLGINPDNWGKVFEKGYSESKSTGSGLAISKSLIEKYNGRMYIKESAINIGTTISIELNEGVK